MCQNNTKIILFCLFFQLATANSTRAAKALAQQRIREQTRKEPSRVFLKKRSRKTMPKLQIAQPKNHPTTSILSLPKRK